MKYFVFSLLGILVLFIYILHTIYDIPVVYAQNCSNSASRAEGLITSPQVGDTSKFGTSSGACIIDPKAVFTPYKIPTYEDLKSLYFTQAKSTADITKHAILSGNKTHSDIPMTTGNDHIYNITGNLTIDDNISGNQTGLIFVDKDLTINSNITYENTNSGIVFIVKG